MKSVISKVFVGIGLLIVTGCTKQNLTPDQTVPAVDVYVGGISGPLGGPPRLATWWKNGESHKALDTAGSPAVFSIAVSGNDVYLAGRVIKPWGGSTTTPLATYWKNGVAVQLSTNPSFAYAVSVSDGTVAIAGQVSKNYSPLTAVYWQNGAITNISDGTVATEIWGMASNGPDVYIVGRAGSTGGYWKNGVFVALTDKTTVSNAYGLALNGSDVYVAGTTGPPDNPTPFYWKNGIPHPLAASAYNSPAGGIVVSGNDVYVAGSISTEAAGWPTVAVYWKNGVQTQLTYGSYSTEATAIAVNGADVYVAGSAYTGTDYIPLVWKNGVPTKLADNGMANALVLVSK